MIGNLTHCQWGRESLAWYVRRYMWLGSINWNQSQFLDNEDRLNAWVVQLYCTPVCCSRGAVSCLIFCSCIYRRNNAAVVFRFDVTKSGISQSWALGNVLLTGSVDSYICDLYPELNGGTRPVELPISKRKFAYTCMTEALQCMQKMVPAVQQLFPQVRELLILLTANPASSATAERSLGSLRRLKTWLITTISREKPNSCAACNTHRTILNVVDVNSICNEFISHNYFRLRLFGRPIGK